MTYDSQLINVTDDFERFSATPAIVHHAVEYYFDLIENELYEFHSTLDTFPDPYNIAITIADMWGDKNFIYTEITDPTTFCIERGDASTDILNISFTPSEIDVQNETYYRISAIILDTFHTDTHTTSHNYIALDPYMNRYVLKSKVTELFTYINAWLN